MGSAAQCAAEPVGHRLLESAQRICRRWRTAKKATISTDRINSPHSDKVGMDAGAESVTKDTATVHDALTGLVVYVLPTRVPPQALPPVAMRAIKPGSGANVYTTVSPGVAILVTPSGVTVPLGPPVAVTDSGAKLKATLQSAVTGLIV